ncbi:MAG: hypothetical protein HYZ31_00580, partial [Gammaproteobacteria bacterium]|nr:hypothetical protein [Gammaproteobacteria bacterium]
MANKSTQNIDVVSGRIMMPLFPQGIGATHPSGCSSLMLSKPFTSENDGPIEEIMRNIRNLESEPSPSCAVVSRAISSQKERTIEETLFDARSNVKILISQISMHLKPEWREKLFRQIDILHEIDEWESGDKPINLLSFKLFIRWALQCKAERCPNFGLSNEGNLITSWQADKDRLIIEFLPNDRVKWIVSMRIQDETERSAGLADINRLITILGPYKPEHWFFPKDR